jgi:hypothetical protein
MTRVVNRIKGLLDVHGVVVPIMRGLPREMPLYPELRKWNGEQLPPDAHAHLRREWHRLSFLRRERRALVADWRALP